MQIASGRCNGKREVEMEVSGRCRLTDMSNQPDQIDAGGLSDHPFRGLPKRVSRNDVGHRHCFPVSICRELE